MRFDFGKTRPDWLDGEDNIILYAQVKNISTEGEWLEWSGLRSLGGHSFVHGYYEIDGNVVTFVYVHDMIRLEEVYEIRMAERDAALERTRENRERVAQEREEQEREGQAQAAREKEELANQEVEDEPSLPREPSRWGLEWFEGGTLHQATVKEWRSASAPNKLAQVQVGQWPLKI